MSWNVFRPLGMILTMLGSVQLASANALRVSNVSVARTDRDSRTADIRFDLSWSNSWHAAWVETSTDGYGDISLTNWDAAWVFIKYRARSGSADTNWHHAWLAANGHAAPAGYAVDVGANGGVTNVGAFVHRTANGYGGVNLTGVKLRWNYGADANDLTVDTPIDLAVYAIEMVYVPECTFVVGTRGAESGSFTEGSWVSGATIPFRIASEATLTISNATGCLWGTSTNSTSTAQIGPPGTLDAAFPKGYKAFYCMKYMITQEQYTDFLNSLTRDQQANLVQTVQPSCYAIRGVKVADYPVRGKVVYGNGICTPATVPAGPIVFGCDFNTNGIFNEVGDGQDLACNFLPWPLETAYADWAGLRPMTELEYEKACRGPKTPTKNEYAWGTTYVPAQDNLFGIDGSGTETALPETARCLYSSYGGKTLIGMVRGGIYARAGTTRDEAGAGYWGAMELSGNLEERVISVGSESGRLFTGRHGDGNLAANGDATVDSWPDETAFGTGARGSCFSSSAARMCISDRSAAVSIKAESLAASMWVGLGFRGVRTAP